MRLRLILPALAAALLLALTACTSAEDTDTTSTSTSTPAPGITPDGLHALTDLTFHITWNEATEPERDDLCTSLALLGPDWAADEMQQGADGSTELDWDRMTELLGNECALR